MKHHRKVIFELLALFVFAYHGAAQKCDSGTLNLGTISSQWLYKNADLQINYQLPDGWYIYDYAAHEKKYLRIGSDFRKMSEVLFEQGSWSGPTIEMAEVKRLGLDFPMTFFSIIKLNDTVPTIIAENELQQNYSVSLRGYYADTADTDSFLRTLYKKVTRQNEKDPELKEGKLGDMSYRYFLLTNTNKSGVKEHWIFGDRNIGCINLVVRIIYVTDDDLVLINDACKDLKFGK